MPFGFCNAPSTFQRMMEATLRGLQWHQCLIYLDDVIVFSQTFNDHLRHLSLVFVCLRIANLKLKSSKCKFGCKTIQYLGFMATPDGIGSDPGKVASVRDYPVLTALKQLRAFLGLVNYRRFISNFAHIANPLTQLTRKHQPFVWTEQCQQAFDTLKQTLISAPILAYPDFSLLFGLQVDASNTAIGMVLAQKQNDREVVIAYASRTLNRSECNYSATEREALTVVEGIQYFQHYLYGHHFTVVTDHYALRWLMGIKDQNGHLARWSLIEFQSYDFDIKHRPGKSNGNADALSRATDFPTIAAIKTLKQSGFSSDLIKTLQCKDPFLSDLISYLESDQLPPSNKIAHSLLLTIDDYFMEDGILYHIWTPVGCQERDSFVQLVVPKSLHLEILQAAHDDVLAGYLGIAKTYEVIRRQFYWHQMFVDVSHYCKSCRDCAMKKAPRSGHKAPLIHIAVESPFHRVGVNCLEPLPMTMSGNRYIVVFTDYFTKWPEAFAVPSIEATHIARLLLDHIIA